MNQTQLSGRLTAEPKVTYGQGENSGVARFTLAVDRRFKREGQPDADFINCVCFGKSAEFVSKYLHKGTKIIASGRIQTGSYTNRDGNKVYTTDVVLEQMEFAESKASAQQNQVSAPQSVPQQPTAPYPQGQPVQQAVPYTPQAQYATQPTPYPQQTAPQYGQPVQATNPNDFVNIPDGIAEELPFS